MTDPTEHEDESEATESPPEGEDESDARDTHVGEGPATERPEGAPTQHRIQAAESLADLDPEATVNLTGDFEATVNLTGGSVVLPGRDDSARPPPPAEEEDDAALAHEVTRGHLKGLLEALIFASDKPIKAGELAKTATAPAKLVKELLEELKNEYAPRGMQLDEVAGGSIFRTNAAYAPFVRNLTKTRPVRLSRAQIETLAILAYRQPITRPEVDEIRGVDCGPVLKVLLERDLVRILGKKDEPGRPWLYGTTTQFLEFFGLKSLRDLPTLREFTDLNEESRRTVERELGETLESVAAASVPAAASAPQAEDHDGGFPADTLPPEMLMDEPGTIETEIPPSHISSPRPPARAAASESIDLQAEVGADDDETAADLEAGSVNAGPPAAKKPEGELDPEEEFPDDDDADFEDDDDEDDDEEEEDEEEKDD